MNALPLRKLALLVLAVLVGTALTVGAYLEDRAGARPTPWVHVAASLRSARLVVPEALQPRLPLRVECPLSVGECPLRPAALDPRCQPG